jgi:hypothetical protein
MFSIQTVQLHTDNYKLTTDNLPLITREKNELPWTRFFIIQ